MTYVANISGNINSELSQREILEFNAGFEGYASKEQGYLGIKNAISMQEFATICNLSREWNRTNPTDKIKITVTSTGGGGKQTVGREIVNKVNNDYMYIDSNKPLEDLFVDLSGYGALETFYFEFEIRNIGYNNETGRVEQISLNMLQKTT